MLGEGHSAAWTAATKSQNRKIEAGTEAHKVKPPLTRRSQQVMRLLCGYATATAIIMEQSGALFDIDNAENSVRHSIVIDDDYLPRGDGERS